MSDAPALVSGYVEDVVRRLRDLPAAERAEIEADLRRHLVEIGCVSGRDCVDRLGTPERYAAELREGLGLGEYRRPRRRPPIALVGVIAAVVAVAGAALVLRDDPLPDDFAPLAAGSWSSSGTDVRSAGGLLIGIGDEIGTARATIVVLNRSDRTLEVDRIELTTVRAREFETSIGGSPTAPLRPGEIEISSIWAPDVRVEAVEDPNHTVVRDHLESGEPFAPFEWAPGQAYLLSVDGPVAPCSEIDAALVDGRGGPISVSFTVGDRHVESAVLTYTFDTRPC